MNAPVVGLLSAVGVAIGLSGAASSDNLDGAVDVHVGAAKAAAGHEYTGLFNLLCAAPAPATGAFARDAAARSPRPFPVARRAGQGLRQSLLGRADRIFRLGGHHIGGNHPHRHDLLATRLKTRSSGLEKARVGSGHDQVRHCQPRPRRSLRRSQVSSGAFRHTGDPVGGGLGFARSQSGAETEAGYGRHRRSAVDARRHDADALPDTGSYAGHDLDAHSSQGRRQAPPRGGVGRHDIQLAPKQAGLHHAGHAGPFWFDTYSTSARRFRDMVKRAGADALISNHTIFDGSKSSCRQWPRASPAILTPMSSAMTAFSGI